ncbi:MAG: HEAT repeat domain-containing protein [Candidatus Sericytochromatia bacterium]|nr:HEAT repeat domain-containing protein [Candidatus Sericytochromatia bacterium]
MKLPGDPSGLPAGRLEVALREAADRHDEEAFATLIDWILERRPTEAVELLARYLGHTRGIGRRAAHALLRLGESAAPVLRELLESGSPRAQIDAAWALGSLPGEESRRALLAGVSHPAGDQALTDACIDALMEMADPMSLQPLLELAQRDQPPSRLARLCRALGHLGEKEAIPVLMSHLSHADEDVRLRAAEALARLSEASAWPVLFTLLRGSSPVSSELAGTLRALGDLTRSAPLLLGAADESERVRRDTAEALGAIGDVRAVGPLMEVSEDANPWIRGEVAYALGRIADRRGLPCLLRALKDPSDWVRMCAIRGLGLLGDPSTLKHVRPLLEDANPEVRSAARDASEMLELDL